MTDLLSSIGNFLTKPLSLDNFGSRAIYNANGVQIGYYDTLQDLANGVIHYTVNAGGTVDAPSTWQMNGGPLAIRQSVAKYLISQNIQPTWNVPASVAADVATANTPFGWDTLGADVSAGFGTIWDGSLPAFNFGTSPIDTTKLGTYALWGGLGLLGLIVVMKKA